tara:strand:- start:215 stop:1402 length:1188 start_codon:yes stop_codon:yes gene_type:complete
MLTFNGLISPDLSEHTSNVLTNDNAEILTFYVDNKVGWQYIDSYTYANKKYNIGKNEIRIFSTGHSDIEIEFIRSIFQRLDKLIDIDFIEMDNNNGSDIDIYGINYSSLLQANGVGNVVAQTSSAGYWWDVFWKNTEDNLNLNANDKNTIIHEIGHILGLSHPNENAFDPSLTTDQTVMSYNMSPDGWDTWYSKTDIQALQKIWGRENDNGKIQFNENSYDLSFIRTAEKKYIVRSIIGNEDITKIDQLIFQDKNFDVQKDIIGVFDQITGMNDASGKIYRLYNSAFNRFPDPAGLEYWISMNQSKENSYRQIANSFIESKEFKSTYGPDISDEEYINLLYKNILDRESDVEGYNYWSNNLNLGIEDRTDILMGFSESIENKLIFSEETNIAAIF